MKRDIRTQVLEYVPKQINNLSLEEIKLERQMYIGVASPIQVEKPQVCEMYSINSVARDKTLSGDFDKFVQEKLKHLMKKDYSVLEPVLRQYKHLFYRLGGTELGSTNQVEHSIETGDARPIKRTPYRTPHALKPVVDEHIDDMLQRNIIEPSMSPWSSSIVLVQKKSKDGSHRGHFQFIKMPFGLNNAPATYRRCIDMVLFGLKGIDCLVYLDDIICLSATMEEHAQKLQSIFERLEHANFKIQPEKCVFAQILLSV
jgi:hypothetical protein